MFKEVKISENDFIKLLEFSNNNIHCNDSELFFLHNLENCEGFELGFILDEISDCFCLSKVVYDFFKYSNRYNGFLKERIVDGVEYIEIVIKDNSEIIDNINKAFKKFGFEKTFYEPYSNILIHIGFKRGKIKRQDFLYCIENRSYKPKIDREGIIINNDLSYVKRKFFYKMPLSKEDCKKIAKEEGKFSCFGCILYKIDLSQCEDIEYYYSVDNSDMVFITKNIPQKAITIEMKIKPNDYDGM